MPGDPMALFNEAATLARSGRLEEAVQVYDQVLSSLEQTLTAVNRQSEPAAQYGPGVHYGLAVALYNKALALNQLGRTEEEIAAYDQIVTRFGNSTQGEMPEMRQQVAQALVNKGTALFRLDRLVEGVLVCDEVMDRFGQDSQPEIRRQVAMAIENKRIVQVRSGPIDKDFAPMSLAGALAVQAIDAAHHLAPNLGIKMTGRPWPEPESGLIAALNELHELGVKLSLGDYGGPGSSATPANMRKFPYWSKIYIHQSASVEDIAEAVAYATEINASLVFHDRSPDEVGRFVGDFAGPVSIQSDDYGPLGYVPGSGQNKPRPLP